MSADNMTTTTIATDAPSAFGVKLYRAIWRWNFYAGLIVVPFLTFLALTGLIMLYGNSIDTFLGPKYHVIAGGERASTITQALMAEQSVSGGKASLFVNPPADEIASYFIVKAGEAQTVVVVDPHGPKILASYSRDNTWFNWASGLHGTMWIGDIGDRILEVTAGLGIILVITGCYLWWPRDGRGIIGALFPRLSLKSRALWRELHKSIGFWMSVVLLFFFITGMAWTGIWGSKIVQAWSTFPAAKWDSVPLSDKTMVTLNGGALKEVPWPLEQTKLPASGSQAGVVGVPAGSPVNLNTVTDFAKTIGFNEQFRVNIPNGEEGVFTVSADSMDGDTTSPFGDHTVHIDQYTGKVLADISFADYSLGGKSMAAGIALHQGNLGIWNTLLNTVFCLAMIFLSVSGVVMWWKRRTVGTLSAPLYPRDYHVPKAILVIGLLVCAIFPLTGTAVVVFAIIDFFLPKHMKEAGVLA